MEGSTGFDRRRDRRNATSQATQSQASDEVLPRAATDKVEISSGPASSAENATRRSRPASSQSKVARESRASQEQVARQASAATASGSGTGANGSFVTTAANGNRRTNNGYPASAHSQMDRQDPDFDRRYDKWAVRAPSLPHHPPHQIPVPIFSQLLYPYAVQATAPHMHPSQVHLRSVNAPGGQVQQANASQYQSIQVHHTPTGAMMIQHFGQGIGGLTADYAGRNMGVSDHVSPYDVPPVDQLNASHSREMSSLQHQGVPPQLTRNHSPTYGLDSTVDFPPLP